MNVSLTADLEEFISSKVKSGRYGSASEVVREALRLLETHDQTRLAELAAFNNELGRRLRSLEKGHYVSPESARARLKKASDRRRSRSA